MRSSGSEAWNPSDSSRTARLSAKKLKYLKKPRMPRSRTALAATQPLRARGEGAWPMACAKKKSVVVERQQEQEAPVPGAVEQIAGGEEQAVLAAVRQKQVEQEDDREEDEECQAVEQHGTG